MKSPDPKEVECLARVIHEVEGRPSGAKAPDYIRHHARRFLAMMAEYEAIKARRAETNN